MRIYSPNYLLLLPVSLLYLPLVHGVILGGSFSLILFCSAITITLTVFVVSNFKEVWFSEERLIFKYPLIRRQKEIEYSKVKGITYQFFYEPRYRHQWKVITLLTESGDKYVFRRLFFSKFILLEFHLLFKFKQLKKVDLTELNQFEFNDFQRENKYFDIQKSKRDIGNSLIVLAIVLALRFALARSLQYNIYLDSFLLAIISMLMLRVRNGFFTLSKRKKLE